MAYIGKTPVLGNFIKLDAITTSSTASYTMNYAGSPYSPQSVNHMLVSLNGVIQAPTDAYTISGSTITFSSTLSSSDSIDFIMIYGNVLDIGTPSDGTITAAKLAGGISGLISWQSVQTTGFTAVAGRGYPCNTTSAAFTVTLPATPSVGDTIILLDYAGTFATNNITLGANSNKIDGGTANKVLSTTREAVTVTYIDATQGWVASSGVNEGTVALSEVPISIDYLVLAGGGGGGQGAGGGGGGSGGYRTGTANISVGTTITLTVGDGGAGSSGASTSGSTGSNSSISGSGVTTITSAGGGGGGSSNTAPAGTGLDGGSGGGAGGGSGGTASGGSGNTPSTSPVQGYNGGTAEDGSSGNRPGGGGGGSSAVGSNSQASLGGNGGNGTASSITGSSVTRGGGGGAGCGANGTSGGTGGTGGGGNGAKGGSSNSTAGTANLGGGGGGGSDFSDSRAGSSGGKGVVILSLLTSKYSGTTTGSPTVTTSGSNTILQFNGTGSYTV